VGGGAARVVAAVLRVGSVTGPPCRATTGRSLRHSARRCVPKSMTPARHAPSPAQVDIAIVMSRPRAGAARGGGGRGQGTITGPLSASEDARDVTAGGGRGGAGAALGPAAACPCPKGRPPPPTPGPGSSKPLTLARHRAGTRSHATSAERSLRAGRCAGRALLPFQSSDSTRRIWSTTSRSQPS
jgi:hypothetical protein